MASSDKESAPMAISKVAVVAAPIAAHEFEPGTNIDDLTRRTSLSHGDFDAQTDDFGSPLTKSKKPVPVHPSSSKEPKSQTLRDALGRMLDVAGQLVAVSRIPLSIWLALVFVLSVSDMETLSAKCSSTSAPPGSSLSCRGHLFFFTSSSGYLCGIPSRTAWSHNEGC